LAEKEQTADELEIQALARMIDDVYPKNNKNLCEIKKENTYFYIDSKATLAWITMDKFLGKVFLNRRI
jgi:hypothetical protein